MIMPEMKLAFKDCVFYRRKKKFFLALLLFPITCITLYLHCNDNPNLLIQYKTISLQKNQSNFKKFTCEGLLQGDKALLSLYKNSTKSLVPEKPLSFYADLSTNETLCAIFKYEYPYTWQDYSLITVSELEFPIAFTYAIYTDIDRFARLLRIMYRPHNVYVVHVDKKSSKVFHSAVKGIQECLGPRNIHVLSGDYQVNVKWGCFSDLQCHFNSMRYLIDNTVKAFDGKNYVDWKYYINLSGREFPLRTNYEIVQILRTLSHRNHIGLDRDYDWSKRFPAKNNATGNVKYEKGFVYIMVTRQYCLFAVKDKRAKAIYDALEEHNKLKCLFDDEVFFQTLQFNPQLGTPGGCRVNSTLTPADLNVFYKRMYSVWNAEDFHSKKRIRDVCIFGVDDLKYLMKSYAYVIANKFYTRIDPAAYDCLEFLLADRAEKQQRHLIKSNRKSVLVDVKPYEHNNLCEN